MRKLYRCREERRIAGVCGGIGMALGIDPTIIRLATIFLLVATGILPVTVTYLVGWLIVPLEP